jgi:hypothetical protein
MSEKVVRIFEETLRQRWGVEWLFICDLADDDADEEEKDPSAPDDG